MGINAGPEGQTTRKSRGAGSAARATGVALAAILFAAPRAGAQTPASAAPGQATVLSPSAFTRLVAGKPVRITGADGFHRQGIFKSLSTTSVVVTFDGAETSVPLDQIARVEKPSNRMKLHTLIGFGVGAGLGVWSAASLCSDSTGGCYASTAVGSVFLYGTIGAGVGAGVGALLNTLNHDRDVLYEAAGPVTAGTRVTSPGRKDPAAFARVSPGKKVRITRPDGFRRDGVVQSVSSTAVEVKFGDRAESLPFDQIDKVEKLTNHLKKGTIIGLSIGGGLAVLGVATCGADCGGGESAALVGVYAGVGAAMGLGIGAMVSAAKPNGHVVYDAGSHRTTIAFAPIVSRTRKGLVFTMAWR